MMPAYIVKKVTLACLLVYQQQVRDIKLLGSYRISYYFTRPRALGGLFRTIVKLGIKAHKNRAGECFGRSIKQPASAQALYKDFCDLCRSGGIADILF